MTTINRLPEYTIILNGDTKLIFSFVGSGVKNLLHLDPVFFVKSFVHFKYVIHQMFGDFQGRKQ